MHLLHVESSPRGPRSASNEIAQAFIDAWSTHHPGATIDTLDVWQTDLPPFDGAAIDAKYAGLTGQPLTTDQQTAWEAIRTLADRFIDADIIVFGVPMWNFGIPYRLKHLFDVISQKDILFTFDDRGLLGLLGGRKVVTVATRGVALGEGFPREDFDFQTAYMDAWCRMVGITDISRIEAEKTLYGPEQDTASRAQACDAAKALAATI